jgi:hypothetical protein
MIKSRRFMSTAGVLFFASVLTVIKSGTKNLLKRQVIFHRLQRMLLRG